jgi:hypothetical protein
MSQLQHVLEAWLAGAEAKLNDDSLTTTDFQQLRQIVQSATPRQRLLYLHTKAPSIYAPVIGMAQHEPVAGQKDTLRTRTAWPYETVHAAIVDGWQVIHFPNLLAPFDDRELDYVGFEFILQKMEVMIND